MECPFCDSDQWKMASLVYREGISHFSARTLSQNVNQFNNEVGANRVFDSTGTQQTGISKLAAPPNGYKFTWILGIGFVFLVLLVIQGGFFAIPTLIIVGISIFNIFPAEKTIHQQNCSNWGNTRMCMRCGKFYIPYTNIILDEASETLIKKEVYELGAKAKCLLFVCFLSGFVSFKYADFIDKSARWFFLKAKENQGDKGGVGELDKSGTSRVFLVNGAKVEFVNIPAGEFVQGSDCDPSEKEHFVKIIQPFFLGKFEVKQDLWVKVMGENPSVFVGASNPVDNVSWNSCSNFINKLNGIVANGKFRFPTESEWEYACKAGVNNKFNFGETIQFKQANFGGKMGRTVEVGLYTPNAFGLYDMHGNVAEWVNDWYEPYISGDGPARIVGGKYKVLRGGSYNYDGNFCRSAVRGYFVPQLADSTFGLRIAWNP